MFGLATIWMDIIIKPVINECFHQDFDFKFQVLESDENLYSCNKIRKSLIPSILTTSENL